MKKIILLLTLSLSYSFKAEHATERSTANFPIMIDSFCEYVHERVYFLRRLEKIIALFQQLDKSDKINTNFNHFDPNMFYHPRIRQLITSLDNSADLEAFFELWNELHEYKYIDDEPLIKEFTRFTLLIAKKLCPTEYARSADESDIIFSLSGGNYTQAITLRDYSSKRLTRPLHLLSRIRCSNETIFESPSNGPTCNCVFESHLQFKHPKINACLEQMAHTNSLAPLFNLSQKFNRYHLIQDELFHKEFLLLIFGIYKNILTSNATSKKIPLTKSTLDMIVKLYENIDKLPLEQILDTIDFLSQELPQILEKYDLENETNWTKWLKEHWWVPPVVITTLGIKVFLIFKYAVPREAPYSRAPAHAAPIPSNPSLANEE